MNLILYVEAFLWLEVIRSWSWDNQDSAFS